MPVPKYNELFNPTLKSLHLLGGSGTNEEIERTVAEILHLSDDDIAEIHRGSTTKLSYRLAWARNYLKRFGLLENSSKAVWALTAKGQKTTKVNPVEVNRAVKALDKHESVSNDSENIETTQENSTLEWEQELLQELQKVSPNGFERLCQRLLREAGFIEVRVTGKSGDGGIDGTGVIRVNLISFRVIFQCKRYKGSVSSQQMREFKGTMAGRAERGLYITTGSFTREARAEANRDGSAPIDLVDGERLVDLMKEYRLGINVITEERISINSEWFASYL